MGSFSRARFATSCSRDLAFVRPNWGDETVLNRDIQYHMTRKIYYEPRA